MARIAYSVGREKTMLADPIVQIVSLPSLRQECADMRIFTEELRATLRNLPHLVAGVGGPETRNLES